MKARQFGHMRRLSKFWVLRFNCTGPCSLSHIHPVYKLIESMARVNSMPRSEQEHREEIVHVGRLMFDKGWIAANDGNISVRLDNGLLLATPRGLSKGMLKPEDMVVVDTDGQKVSGALEVTTE